MLQQKYSFPTGHVLKNRLTLAPLTNLQSFEDGQLSDEELNWLTLRAQGGFALVMTCAAHVMENGKGFSGQLGIWSEHHLAGHQRIVQNLHQENALAIVQLHHAGSRADLTWVEKPWSPSAVEGTDTENCHAMTLDEVYQLRDAFIQAAQRAKKAGYDGVEVHGAHGYVLCQFFSAAINQRADQYGGNLENRSRLIDEILRGIRQTCGNEFIIGLRLSPERFGMQLSEVLTCAQKWISQGMIDFLDASLWDVFKPALAPMHSDWDLLEHFLQLDFHSPRGQVPLFVAGNLRDAHSIQNALQRGVDVLSIGRGGILHADFAHQVMNNSDFECITLPVSKEYLQSQGLSAKFIGYMSRWDGFVMADS